MKKKKKKPSIGLAKFFDSHVREKQYAYSMSTIANYGTALRSLMRYLGQDDIAVDALTDDTVAGYQRWLLEQGVCLNTVSCYMRSLRSLCGKAADSGLPPRQQVFGKAYTGRMKTTKRAIRIDDIERIAHLRLDDGSSLALTRDVFLFSFCAMGMPFVDICHLQKKQIASGYLRYNRKKTGQPVVVRLEKYMRAIIGRYANCHPTYVFPLIKASEPADAYAEYLKALGSYNRTLKVLAARADIDVNLTSYTPRHSWASIAYGSNVDLPVISKALGHTNTNTTLTYIKEIDDNRVENANARLLENLGLT
ncbi:MAG: site-specific integrase [Prevotella sp.]|nr:site-specific integrase [Prevotella sp.]MBO6204366.1 site-specific integrase [Selenomonas sp.]MBP3745659.1 site-specific integrase [Prevotella sp.]